MSENSKPRRTRISAYAILIKDQSILLCRCSPETDVPGEWTLPGGGINFGEDPAHAAVREMKEETGFDVTLGGLLAIDSKYIDAGDAEHHAVRIIYAATITGGELTVEANGSTDLCDWIPLNDMDTYPLVSLAKAGARLARQQIETE